MKERVAIIMPTFNSYNITNKAIYKLLEQTYKDFDIIVVDAGSDDHKKLKEIFGDKKNIIILHTDKDLGGSGSFWLGIKYACGKMYDILILSDNDALPLSNNLIEKLISEIKKDRDSIILPINLNYNYNLSVSQDYSPLHFLTVRGSYLSGVRFPKNFFVHNDDFVLAQELKLKGCRIKRVDAYYSHPMTFPRIYYLARNPTYIYVYKQQYNLPFLRLFSSYIALLIQSAYICSLDSFKALFLGLMHGLFQKLGKSYASFSLLSLKGFGKAVKDTPKVDLLVFAGNKTFMSHLLKEGKIVAKEAVHYANKRRVVARIFKHVNKFITTDVGFTIFSILLILSKEVFVINWTPYEFTLQRYRMEPFKKILAFLMALPLYILLLAMIFLKIAVKFNSVMGDYVKGKI